MEPFKNKSGEIYDLTNMLSKVKQETTGYYIAVYCVSL